MSKRKNYIEVKDIRIERINSDGIVIKDRYTKMPLIKVKSLRGLDK